MTHHRFLHHPLFVVAWLVIAAVLMLIVSPIGAVHPVEAQTTCIRFDDAMLVEWGFMGAYTDQSTSQDAINYLSSMVMTPYAGDITITHRPVDIRLTGKTGVIGTIHVLFDDTRDVWFYQLADAQAMGCGLYVIQIHDSIHFLDLMGG